MDKDNGNNEKLKWNHGVSLEWQVGKLKQEMKQKQFNRGEKRMCLGDAGQVTWAKLRPCGHKLF